MLTALVRPPTAALARCELTYLDREPIDATRAQRQHAAYVECLRDLDVRILALAPEPELPDAVFVEDTAIVVDEVAVITRPGAASRRSEVTTVAEALRPYRTLRALTAPATLDGGDVLEIGRAFYVGIAPGGRSNEEGVAQLREHLSPYGYSVHAVPLDGCLHLKTAATYLGRGLLLANPAWLDGARFEGVEMLAVPHDEPYAANTLTIGETTLLPANFPRTRALLERHGFSVRTLDTSEMQKAEAGVTCQSIPFDSKEDAAR
ncbi:MAG TPA: N(G),N(G)-dimethylarginine dimethylaminohydrolase [Ktedonobacterales bacterium]